MTKTDITFEKSDRLIGFLSMCADVLNSPFDEMKVTIIELLLSQKMGGMIPSEIPKENPNKELLDGIRNNPIPQIKEIEDEFYNNVSNLHDLPFVYRLFCAKWNKKIPLIKFDLSGLYTTDENTYCITGIKMHTQIILSELEEMFSYLSIAAGLGTPILFKEDYISNFISNSFDEESNKKNNKKLKTSLIDKELKYLYRLLIKDQFIECPEPIFLGAFKNDFISPVKWIKLSSKKTKSTQPLVELLRFIEVPESQITDKEIISTLFLDSDNKPMSFNFNNNKANLQSQYYKHLESIVNTSKGIR